MTPEAKAKKNAYQRSQWQRDEAVREGNYWRLAMRRYGLTKADAERLVGEQGGGCYLCARPFKGRPHVDHFHDPELGFESPRGWRWREGTTPEQKRRTVRGLSCAKCNGALGHFWDEPAVLRDVAEQLDRWKRAYAT